MPSNRVIGLDLGGTKILVGIVHRDGRIERHLEMPTPLESQAELLDGLEASARELLDEEIAAVGFGIPSAIDQETGRVEGSVNIPLEDFDFRAEMSRRLGLPVAIENDANAATLGEFVVGAGRSARTMVMLTLGTGCGGGVVLDGKLYRGWAEFGHIVIEFDGIPCQGSCHGRGHLEPYVTGEAATKLAQEAFGPAVDAHRLVRLATEGDEQALEILTGIGRRLGAGAGSLANAFGAPLVVIGGGFGRAAFSFLHDAALEVAHREALTPLDEELRIVPSELGTMAGLTGAGLVAFEALQ